MKTSSTLSFLSALISIGCVNAGCYGSSTLPGDSWDEYQKSNARWNTERACRGYDGIQGRFQGTFGPGETRYVCIQDSWNQKHEFWVQNLNTGASLWLDDRDCVLRLHNQINGCGTAGGEETIAGWYFRADPNSGSC